MAENWTFGYKKFLNATGIISTGQSNLVLIFSHEQNYSFHL